MSLLLTLFAIQLIVYLSARPYRRRYKNIIVIAVYAALTCCTGIMLAALILRRRAEARRLQEEAALAEQDQQQLVEGGGGSGGDSVSAAASDGSGGDGNAEHGAEDVLGGAFVSVIVVAIVMAIVVYAAMSRRSLESKARKEHATEVNALRKRIEAGDDAASRVGDASAGANDDSRDFAPAQGSEFSADDPPARPSRGMSFVDNVHTLTPMTGRHIRAAAAQRRTTSGDSKDFEATTTAGRAQRNTGGEGHNRAAGQNIAPHSLPPLLTVSPARAAADLPLDALRRGTSGSQDEIVPSAGPGLGRAPRPNSPHSAHTPAVMTPPPPRRPPIPTHNLDRRAIKGPAPHHLQQPPPRGRRLSTSGLRVPLPPGRTSPRPPSASGSGGAHGTLPLPGGKNNNAAPRRGSTHSLHGPRRHKGPAIPGGVVPPLITPTRNAVLQRGGPGRRGHPTTSVRRAPHGLPPPPPLHSRSSSNIADGGGGGGRDVSAGRSGTNLGPTGGGVSGLRPSGSLQTLTAASPPQLPADTVIPPLPLMLRKKQHAPALQSVPETNDEHICNGSPPRSVIRRESSPQSLSNNSQAPPVDAGSLSPTARAAPSARPASRRPSSARSSGGSTPRSAAAATRRPSLEAAGSAPATPRRTVSSIAPPELPQQARPQVSGTLGSLEGDSREAWSPEPARRSTPPPPPLPPASSVPFPAGRSGSSLDRRLDERRAKTQDFRQK
jgi:hypothetical protein